MFINQETAPTWKSPTPVTNNVATDFANNIKRLLFSELMQVRKRRQEIVKEKKPLLGINTREAEQLLIFLWQLFCQQGNHQSFYIRMNRHKIVVLCWFFLINNEIFHKITVKLTTNVICSTFYLLFSMARSCNMRRMKNSNGKRKMNKNLGSNMGNLKKGKKCHDRA